MTILLSENGMVNINAQAADNELWLTCAEVELATGWIWKTEGLCKGSVCVPIPDAKAAELVADDLINIAGLWRHLDRPVLHDKAGEAWVLGESASDRNAQLQSLQAPDFTLPDIDGNLHCLSDYRGKKVYLCSWASW